MQTETETLAKIPYISGNGNPKLTETLTETLFKLKKLKKKSYLKKQDFLTFQEMELSNIPGKIY